MIEKIFFFSCAGKKKIDLLDLRERVAKLQLKVKPWRFFHFRSRIDVR
jgi:hypothetical protein